VTECILAYAFHAHFDLKKLLKCLHYLDKKAVAHGCINFELPFDGQTQSSWQQKYIAALLVRFTYGYR
jgi:hypothetical protein